MYLNLIYGTSIEPKSQEPIFYIEKLITCLQIYPSHMT